MVVASSCADSARLSTFEAPWRQTTTIRPGTDGAPPEFHGNFAACASGAACAGPIGADPIAAGDDITNGTVMRVARARQAAIRARNDVSFLWAPGAVLRAGSRHTVQEGCALWHHLGPSAWGITLDAPRERTA